MTTLARTINYESELNAEQLNVVTAGGGRYLVLAGAGSGKTRVLTYRVAHLLKTGVRPEEILLLTFTNKAATEMMSRVRDLTGINTNRLYGGTFHSIANRFLRQHGYLIGYHSSFTIIDQSESYQVINASIAFHGFDPKKTKFPNGKFIGGLYSYARNIDADVIDVLAENYPNLEFRSLQIKAILEEYEKRKAKQNLMDFDDLLCNLRRLLIRQPALRAELNNQFRHVLVDEYQDTNAVQAPFECPEQNRATQAVGLCAFSYRRAWFFMIVYGDRRQFFLTFQAWCIPKAFFFPGQENSICGCKYPIM